MITWQCKKFDELNTQELYAILQLRNEVFVVEQNCVFQDADNKDQGSYHFMGWDNHKLVAYTRITVPGSVYREPSIGRVVTSPLVRGAGIGRKLMEQSIRQVNILFGHTPIRIAAQVHLKKFYDSLGFTAAGEIYVEDGIDHIEMIRT